MCFEHLVDMVWTSARPKDSYVTFKRCPVPTWYIFCHVFKLLTGIVFIFLKQQHALF